MHWREAALFILHYICLHVRHERSGMDDEKKRATDLGRKRGEVGGRIESTAGPKQETDVKIREDGPVKAGVKSTEKEWQKGKYGTKQKVAIL